MRTKLFVGKTGERYSILLNDEGIPLEHPNLFVTTIYRNDGQAASSCQKALEHVSFFLEVCNGLEIDIEARIAKAEFLTHEEIQRIVYFAGITREATRAKLKATNSKVTKLKVAKPRMLETARYSIVAEKKEDKVHWQTKYNRISVFSRYASWLEKYHHPYAQTRTEFYFTELRPQKNEGPTYGEMLEVATYKSFTSEECAVFLDRIRPDYSDNPWDDESIKVRNYAMCMFMWALGVRLGECLNVKLQDLVVKKGKRYVVIRRNADDINDSRINQPRVKTNGRSLALSPKLQKILDNYIYEHRANLQNVATNEFLFVSHRVRKGKLNPLSISAAEKIFAQLSETLGFHVHPHRLRHTWNDRFSEAMDKAIAAGKTNENKSEADRCQLMGWRQGSTMSLVYASRHNAKRAMTLALNMQDADFATKESIKYDEDLPF